MIFLPPLPKQHLVLCLKPSLCLLPPQLSAGAEPSPCAKKCSSTPGLPKSLRSRRWWQNPRSRQIRSPWHGVTPPPHAGMPARANGGRNVAQGSSLQPGLDAPRSSGGSIRSHLSTGAREFRSPQFAAGAACDEDPGEGAKWCLQPPGSPQKLPAGAPCAEEQLASARCSQQQQPRAHPLAFCNG